MVGKFVGGGVGLDLSGHVKVGMKNVSSAAVAQDCTSHFSVLHANCKGMGRCEITVNGEDEVGSCCPHVIVAQHCASFQSSGLTGSRLNVCCRWQN